MAIVYKRSEEMPASEPLSTEAQVLRGFRLGFVLLLIWPTLTLLMTSLSRFPNLAGPLLSLIRGADLIFHEAGHLLFIPFGHFLMVLGGSLTQLLIPILCLLVFYFKEKARFAAAFALWWFGESLMNVAVYINDARDLRLFLITGGTGREVEGHDWAYLLDRLGLLTADHGIGQSLFLIGKLVIVVAIAGLVAFSFVAGPRKALRTDG